MKSIVFDTIPSLEDERDFRYDQKKLSLKQTIDLREWDSSIESQGSVGSCVGNAIANAYELMVRQLYPDKFIELSRLFVYYNSRIFDNSVEDDIGTYIRDGLKSAFRYGMCSEQLWPYLEDNFNKQPTPECYVDASQRVVTRYETLYTLRDMLEVLNDNRPVVIGMNIYEGFMEMNPKTSVLKIPREYTKLIGSHAVVVLGYDLSKQLFLAKNSFGKDWGDNGYFWIPFEYVRTDVFEKWCFDISSQKTIDLDEPINVVKPKPKKHKELIIELSPSGAQVKHKFLDLNRP